MFIQIVSIDTDLIQATYDGKLYISVATTAGDSFFRSGIDVTGDVSGVDDYRATFSFDMVGEQTDILVDNLYNVYFYISVFQTKTTTLP